MHYRQPPFTAETAYIIAAICLFSTGHWLGGLACIIISIATQKSHKSSPEQPQAAEQCCGKSAQARTEGSPSFDK